MAIFIAKISRGRSIRSIFVMLSIVAMAVAVSLVLLTSLWDALRTTLEKGKPGA